MLPISLLTSQLHRNTRLDGFVVMRTSAIKAAPNSFRGYVVGLGARTYMNVAWHPRGRGLRSAAPASLFESEDTTQCSARTSQLVDGEIRRKDLRLNHPPPAVLKKACCPQPTRAWAINLANLFHLGLPSEERGPH
jgi:hypothetical protein